MYMPSLLHKASTRRPATDCLRMRKIIEQFSRKFPIKLKCYKNILIIQSHTELYSQLARDRAARLVAAAISF